MQTRTHERRRAGQGGIKTDGPRWQFPSNIWSGWWLRAAEHDPSVAGIDQRLTIPSAFEERPQNHHLTVLHDRLICAVINSSGLELDWKFCWCVGLRPPLFDSNHELNKVGAFLIDSWININGNGSNLITLSETIAHWLNFNAALPLFIQFIKFIKFIQVKPNIQIEYFAIYNHRSVWWLIES